MPPEPGVTSVGYATGEDASESRKALVKRMLKDVAAAKAHWSDHFQRMLDDQKFARGKQWEQAATGLDSKTRYTVNITQRHVQQRVSALYAKNPQFVAYRRDRIDYTAWDGKPDSIAKAQEQLVSSLQMGMPDPGAAAILQDFQDTMMRREQADRVAKTLEHVMKYYTDEQVIPFKKQMKRVVRRAITTGVAYIKLDYQRVMGLSPDTQRKIADIATRLARIERMGRDLASGDTDPDAPEAEQLRLQLAALEREEQVIVREGLVIDYPSSTAVIPDKRCRSLDGFIGCDWVAQEYMLSPEDIKEIYDADVQKHYTPYVEQAAGSTRYKAAGAAGECDGLALVYEVYHKRDGLVYAVCDGYPDFLREPAAPNIALERFWPIFTLMFNELDDDDDPFPVSDVQLLRHPQMDYNRSRQSLREHRRANRPKYGTAAGMLSEDDKSKLQSHPDSAIIELQALQPGQSVDELLQPFKNAPIDPALYDTGPQFDDVLRSVGTQEANLGGTSSSTATESSIAESSRLSSLQSNVDDLDEFMTEFARCAGMVLLENTSEATVRKIVGPGASWPRLTRGEIQDEIILDVQAGSSGRPNQAAQLQNMERLMPFLLQIPGIKPEWLAQEAITRMDDKLDIADAFDPALPSITAMNSQKQVSTGAPGEDPNAQGGEGGDNAFKPTESEGDNGRPGRPPMDPNLSLEGGSGMAVN